MEIVRIFAAVVLFAVAVLLAHRSLYPNSSVCLSLSHSCY